MKATPIFILVLVLGLSLTACGSATSTSNTSTGILVQDAWARYSPAADAMGAAYFVIDNSGQTDDQLLSVSSDVAMMTEMHQSTESNGVMSMSPVESVTIPAGGQIEFKPGSYHVMLMGLKHELKIGDKVRLTLNFEKAGPVVVECEVRDQ